MALSDMKCRNARPGEKLQKFSDSEGLQFWVQPTGARLWRLAYRFGGKQKLLALGTYPLVTLAAAREARDTARKLLLAGIDPSEDKKPRKLLQYGSGDSFHAIAEEYVAKLKQIAQRRFRLRAIC
ncbi:Arm DNA-binding domain-containing protein [Nitrospirillum iridis]|uniref:Integrase DNA-binding domain-containing protein n=1 Tax=Nitrospirillum iridis TaxID=765888 RepID=A0A7X0B408_9PROT|nr:Arm DNA-binding domain-containing protein [Nitrospirillum iridis]MBB6254972.1 hypothetical protein [Nitrospirillum iridis]